MHSVLSGDISRTENPRADSLRLVNAGELFAVAKSVQFYDWPSPDVEDVDLRFLAT